MELKNKIYNFCVNRYAGIRYRYHRCHDNAEGMVKVLSWLYLIWLNFAVYVLRLSYLKKAHQIELYEEKKLDVYSSESEKYLKKYNNISVDKYVEQLSNYDVISFDIFDTLILRTLSAPVDVFYLIGQKLDVMNFKNIRIWAEHDARIKKNLKYQSMEITLGEIWDNIEEDVGISSLEGQKIECEYEKKLCYANPFMLEVWKKLIKLNKKIIIITDMYLPKECIEEILKNAGFEKYHKLYLSNEYNKSKADGKLYFEVLNDIYGNIEHRKLSIVHVGDNPHSDLIKAKQANFDALPYQNVNKNVFLNRAFDMSPIIGSAYRGIVSNKMYCGLKTYSMEYEYGFIYGGLFVLGYCNFIHEYCKKNKIEKVLFLSRDGEILKKAYDYLYPSDNTEYVYWSRKAATKLEAIYDKHDYFRRFIYHKVNQEYTISNILHSMELDFLVDELVDWKKIWIEKIKKVEGIADDKLKKRLKEFVELKEEDQLTDKNGYLLRQFIEGKWDKVIKHYSIQHKAAKTYYEQILKDVNKAVAVDIGWAGSGAMVLRYLVSNEWKIPSEIIGIIAGTNTLHNAEPDASETFLQSGKLVSYLYSQSHNRDLLKKHDPNKNYNVFWELLLSSPTPQFVGFDLDEKNEILLHFGKYDENQEGIKEIQRGIMEFVKEYDKHFKGFSYMYQISGRDAYAPMLVAASHKERYLKEIEKKFNLEINVN